jgi:hypothetical protein
MAFRTIFPFLRVCAAAWAQQTFDVLPSIPKPKMIIASCSASCPMAAFPPPAPPSDSSGTVAPFVIPNLNEQEQRIPVSPVVFNSQRIDMREALFTASKV